MDSGYEYRIAWQWKGFRPMTSVRTEQDVMRMLTDLTREAMSEFEYARAEKRQVGPWERVGEESGG